jgi:putative membrane protein
MIAHSGTRAFESSLARPLGGSVSRRWPLALGLLVLALLWLGPLPAMAGSSFSAHMILHMGIAVVAAPLLVLGLRPGGHFGRPKRAPVLTPLAAAALEFAVVWGWHAPALCTATQTSNLVFVAEQASWLAIGLVLWASVLRDGPGTGLRLWAGVLALLLTSMHMTLLGTLLALAERPLYPVLLADQRVGGLIMLGAGGIVFLVAGLALAARGLQAFEPTDGASSPPYRGLVGDDTEEGR